MFLYFPDGQQVWEMEATVDKDKSQPVSPQDDPQSSETPQRSLSPVPPASFLPFSPPLPLIPPLYFLLSLLYSSISSSFPFSSPSLPSFSLLPSLFLSYPSLLPLSLHPTLPPPPSLLPTENFIVTQQVQTALSEPATYGAPGPLVCGPDIFTHFARPTFLAGMKS